MKVLLPAGLILSLWSSAAFAGGDLSNLPIRLEGVAVKRIVVSNNPNESLDARMRESCNSNYYELERTLRGSGKILVAKSTCMRSTEFKGYVGFVEYID